MTDADARRILAPAKINLTLAVHGRRSDGYHDLESWVVRIELCDVLEIRPASGLRLQLQGRASGIPADESNLVLRAAKALGAHARVALGADIRLEKHIPHGAGLGGGSSDAAATLVALNQFWNLGLSDAALATLAAGIGSDVPLFLGPPSLVMRGRGEIIEPCPARPRLWVGLVAPPFGVSTAEIFQRFQARPAAARRSPWLADPETMSAETLLPQLFNDLEAPAFDFEPRLAKLHAALERIGNRIVRMTGSGSCLYSLFDSTADAAAWRDAVRSCTPTETEILIVRTL